MIGITSMIRSASRLFPPSHAKGLFCLRHLLLSLVDDAQDVQVVWRSGRCDQRLWRSSGLNTRSAAFDLDVSICFRQQSLALTASTFEHQHHL